MQASLQSRDFGGLHGNLAVRVSVATSFVWTWSPERRSFQKEENEDNLLPSKTSVELFHQTGFYMENTQASFFLSSHTGRNCRQDTRHLVLASNLPFMRTLCPVLRAHTVMEQQLMAFCNLHPHPMPENSEKTCSQFWDTHDLDILSNCRDGIEKKVKRTWMQLGASTCAFPPLSRGDVSQECIKGHTPSIIAWAIIIE